MQLAADVGRWCASRRLAVEDLDEDQITAFHASRVPQQQRPGDAASGRQVLDLLGGTGRIPSSHSGPSDDDLGERIAQSYKRFLLEERGVNPTTAANYLPTVRRFLA